MVFRRPCSKYKRYGIQFIEDSFQPRTEKQALVLGDFFHGITKPHAPSLILNKKDAMFEADLAATVRLKTSF